MALFQSNLLTRPKNFKKKLVKSQFHYYGVLNLVIAVYLQLALLYVCFSKKTKVLKLIKVLLWKNGSIVYVVSLLK